MFLFSLNETYIRYYISQLQKYFYLGRIVYLLIAEKTREMGIPKSELRNLERMNDVVE